MLCSIDGTILLPSVCESPFGLRHSNDDYYTIDPTNQKKIESFGIFQKPSLIKKNEILNCGSSKIEKGLLLRIVNFDAQKYTLYQSLLENYSSKKKKKNCSLARLKISLSRVYTYSPVSLLS